MRKIRKYVKLVSLISSAPSTIWVAFGHKLLFFFFCLENFWILSKVAPLQTYSLLALSFTASHVVLLEILLCEGGLYLSVWKEDC